MKLKSFSGVVVKDLWATGTKSEHMAVCLDVGGRKFKLRLEGGHAFSDPELEALVGQRIRGKGREVAGSTLLMTEWKPDNEG